MSDGLEDIPPESPKSPNRPKRAEDWENLVNPQLTLRGSITGSTHQQEIQDSDVDKPPQSLSESDKGDYLKDEEIADRQANRGLREKYADKAYGLAHFCLVWWMGMLFFQGAYMAMHGITLWSDKVLMSVTAGVTASVLAAFLGVIRGLFPSDKNGSNGKEK